MGPQLLGGLSNAQYRRFGKYMYIWQVATRTKGTQPECLTTVVTWLENESQIYEAQNVHHLELFPATNKKVDAGR